MSPDSSSIQTLLAQLQARYPYGSLTSELLTIHQGHYVVRALVQVGGTLLATGMASAADIEVAEDRAKVRVLEALGLQISASVPASAPANQPLSSATSVISELQGQLLADYSHLSTPAPAPLPALEEEFSDVSTYASSVAAPPLSLPDLPLSDLPLPDLTQASETAEVSQEGPQLPQPSISTAAAASFMTEFDISTLADDETKPLEADSVIHFDPDSDLPSLGETSGLENFSAEPISHFQEMNSGTPGLEASTPAKTTKPAKKKSETADLAAPPAASSAQEDDRSEEIAKIGVEMKRLGWNTAQGRDYLKRTYGKRSRQELNDAELIDFLRYLESQPSPLQSPF